MTKSIIHITVTLMLSCTLSCCSTTRSVHVGFVQERQALLSKEVTMLLPKPFHRQKDNYEEGVIYLYSFADGATIIVFQGAMMVFDIDQYQSTKTKIAGERKTAVGLNHTRYWRKDVYPEGIRIYYDNASVRNKAVYDKVLNEITLKDLRS